jgi:hypothetical protein
MKNDIILRGFINEIESTIEKMIESSTILKQIRTHTKDFPETYVTSVNFGRQTGHTTAIAKLAKNYDDVVIVMMNHNMTRDYEKHQGTSIGVYTINQICTCGAPIEDEKSYDFIIDAYSSITEEQKKNLFRWFSKNEKHVKSIVGVG